MRVASPGGGPHKGGGSWKVFVSGLLAFVLAGKSICPIFRIPGQTGDLPGLSRNLPGPLLQIGTAETPAEQPWTIQTVLCSPV